MCGICAFIYLRKDGQQITEEGTFQEISDQLKRRGPNHSQKLFCSFEHLESGIDLCFAASVLHLRGEIPAWQPITDEQGNVLLWNGEIFGGLALEDSMSDAQVLSQMLFKCGTDEEITSVMSSIRGPFAFILYQAVGCLWFGRDMFGRRSLLWNAEDSVFRLSSVASEKKEWNEVPTSGLFCLHLDNFIHHKSLEVHLYPWSNSPSGSKRENNNKLLKNLTITTCDKLLTTPIQIPLNKSLPTDEELFDSLKLSKEPKLSSSELLTKMLEVPIFRETMADFEDVLSESVMRRVNNHSRLCKNCYEKVGNGDFRNDICHEIDGNSDFRSDICQGKCGNGDFRNDICHEKDGNSDFRSDICQGKCGNGDFRNDICYEKDGNSDFRSDIYQGKCGNGDFKNETGGSADWKCDECGHALVGVLFSGGLDSIVIACLADRHLVKHQPIDLINVAFASSSSLEGCTTHYGHPAFVTPDRKTGREGVEALRRVCPQRTWNFVEVNVTEKDLVHQRSEVISKLLNPSCTVLDDSIGCALWFGASGSGFLSEGPQSYTSPARILLVGMGADEQLGGYSRHRAVFNVSGWSGLMEELSMELDRIGSRNLGRDDRIIADHGVESRYPFLDEDVVSYLNDLPVWLKMNLNFSRGVGEKLLLRILALKLGLTVAAALPKRAIQFGSRIARIENSKEKGSDMCERLKNTVIK